MANKKKIGWFCSYVPEELIMAAGMEPLRLKGQVKNFKEADAYLFSNICPYLKNILDSGLRGRLNGLEGIIFTNSCDGMRKLYDLWIEYVETPFTYMLEVPKRLDKQGIEYFSHQLKRLKSNLEAVLDVNISEGLQSAISIMNEHRAIMGKIFERQRESPPQYKGSEMLALCEEEMMSPKENITPKLLEFSNRTTSHGRSKKEGARILLMGNTVDDPTLFRLVENADCSVVAFDTCNGLKHYTNLVEEGSDPIESLARRYLLKPSCPRMPGFDTRLENTDNLIQQYSVDGIIFTNLKHCDYSLFEAPQIERYAKEKGLPLLVVENDYLWTDIERIRIRVEAFLEMVQGEV
jgi:benzoyl-CoA reductase/2-hydroxyglutaryl-CoA dehydratase subunit BcrC/BadD/HgdB